MGTEKRLIDISKVIDQMQKCIDESPYTRDSIASYTFGAIIECLKKEPTVDAVEVVHGQWVNPYINRYGHPCHCCSVCGFKASYQDKNYCPNCGAKMDSDGNG